MTPGTSELIEVARLLFSRALLFSAGIVVGIMLTVAVQFLFRVLPKLESTASLLKSYYTVTRKERFSTSTKLVAWWLFILVIFILLVIIRLLMW